MRRISIREAAIQIFKDMRRPLHYRDLTKRIIEISQLSGRTPHKTVRSMIGTDSRFNRVANGVYALSEWEQFPVARFAKDIAFEVLRKRGHPMSLESVGEKICEERKFIGSPKQVARNATRLDDRFYYNGDKDVVGLIEWEERGR